jgi:type I restriction enzyme M protein
MFLKVINEFHYDHSEKLGDAFEYLLSVLGSQGDAGQFRTPRHIIDFMVAIMQPKKDESICDPACGTAGFLISSYKHILNENTKKNKGDLLTPDERKKLINNFVGYDISSEMVRLSLVNMYLHGFTTPKIYEYDSLTYTDHWGDTFDIIMANPPFMTPKGGIRPHKKFAMQANRSEVLFVDYIMEHINPTTGRAAVIVPEGIIFQSATAYKALRKLLVEKNFLYGVVSLPAGLFQPYSGVKTSILLLDRTLAKKTDKILFVKIENDGYSLGAQRKELTTSDLPDATNFIKQYITAIRNNDFSLIDFEHLPLNSIAVERNRITENGDYNLSGDRYKDSIAKKQSKFDLVELSEVCDLYQPQTISASDFKENGEYKVFGANGVIGNYDKYNHEDSEVLITCRGATCGTINFSEPKSWITGNAMVAKPIDNRINKRFLFHLLKASDLSSVITGAAQPQITRASLSPFKIPLPPITVQSEIETKIEQFEKIITGAKLVVENYKPQIDIKPEWEMVELGEEIDFVSGLTLSIPECEDENGTPIISMKEVKEDGSLNLSEIRKIKIPNKNYAILQKGDLLFNWRNGSKELVGKTAYFDLDGEYVFASFCLGIRVKKRLNSKFLWVLLNQYRIEGKYMAFMRQNVNGLFNREELKILKIPLPSLKEQESIIYQIEKEQQLVSASKELVNIYEQKIKDEINKLWEE